MVAASKFFDENFTKYAMVHSIKHVMNQSYYGLWCHDRF